jgi:hypothetical protein
MKNIELLFDILCHGADEETMGTNFSFDVKGKKVSLDPIQQKKVVHKGIQAFLWGIGLEEENKGIKTRVQAFSGSSAVTQLTKDVFNVTQAVEVFDVYWDRAFKSIPLKKGQFDWEIANVTSGITYQLIPEGSKVKFYGIGGTKVSASVQKYGTGLEITFETIEGRKLYKFVDLMEQQRAALYKLWATVHYGLIGTAATANQYDWQGESTDTQLQRDILTLNKICYEVGKACKDKWYGDTANGRFILYADPIYKARIMNALNATAADVIRSGAKGETVSYMIDPYFTFDSNLTTDKITVGIPGNKTQNAVYLKDKSFKEQDMSTLSVLSSHWTMFGGIVADTDQWAEAAMADAST